MSEQSRVRTHTRPAHGTEITLYYPSLGEWLTLDEYAYRQMLKHVESGTAALSADDGFVGV